jgi:predicted DNA-binding WGR domain protein
MKRMKKYLLYPHHDTCQFWDIEVAGNSFIVTQGTEGTLGQSLVVSFDSEKACIREATKRVKEKLKLGYVAIPEGYIKRFDAPTALRETLKEKRIVTTPHGFFTLPALEDVKVISVVVNSPTHDGIYCITGYALVKDHPVKNNPGKVLVWLPMADLYATWDVAERQLYTFPGATWNNIEKDLPHYLLRIPPTGDGSPSMELVKDAHDKIWSYFDFIPHSFAAKIDKIQLMSPEARLHDAEDFIKLYALRLLRHPFCSSLADLYSPLVNLCNLLATTLINEAQHRKALTWLERSLLIIHQSAPLRIREHVARRYLPAAGTVLLPPVAVRRRHTLHEFLRGF